MDMHNNNHNNDNNNQNTHNNNMMMKQLCEIIYNIITDELNTQLY